MKTTKYADSVLNKYADYQSRCNRIYFLKSTIHQLSVTEQLELRVLIRWYNSNHVEKVSIR